MNAGMRDFPRNLPYQGQMPWFKFASIIYLFEGYLGYDDLGY